ncbi:MAG: hypothetical protein mread185_000076 [Mycoplasmataceae bacterium]|nr:MAG: hypothetical protein mread185_000076 [Mycoplasmataceae bacterium]
MKQQAIESIKRILVETELENNQLTEKDWQLSIQEAVNEYEISFYYKETLKDILGIFFKKDGIKFPRKYAYYLSSWGERNILDLVNEIIKKQDRITDLEKIIHNLIIKQKSIMIIIKSVEELKYFYSDYSNNHILFADIGGDSWQDRIMDGENEKQIIEECQKTLSKLFERFFRGFGSYSEWNNEKSENFSQLEELSKKFLDKFLEIVKQKLISGEHTEWRFFSCRLNNEEKELIRNSLNIKDLFSEIIPKIKEQQKEEKKLREKVVERLQDLVDKLDVSENDLDVNYLAIKFREDEIPTRKTGWSDNNASGFSFFDEKKVRYKFFEEKVDFGGRSDKDTNTIEKLKAFEQKAITHIYERAIAKRDEKIKILEKKQEISQNIINQLKEKNIDLENQLNQIEQPTK